MIRQERTIDEIDAHPSEFLQEVAEKHGIIGQTRIIVKSRGVGIDTYHEHITDDKVFELVADNQLIALVYLRRDDWNWTEATYIEIPWAIEKVKERLNKKRYPDEVSSDNE
jgi:hypothetical protein